MNTDIENETQWENDVKDFNTEASLEEAIASSRDVSLLYFLVKKYERGGSISYSIKRCMSILEEKCSDDDYFTFLSLLSDKFAYFADYMFTIYCPDFYTNKRTFEFPEQFHTPTNNCFFCEGKKCEYVGICNKCDTLRPNCFWGDEWCTQHCCKTVACHDCSKD